MYNTPSLLEILIGQNQWNSLQRVHSVMMTFAAKRMYRLPFNQIIMKRKNDEKVKNDKTFIFLVMRRILTYTSLVSKTKLVSSLKYVCYLSIAHLLSIYTRNRRQVDDIRHIRRSL